MNISRLNKYFLGLVFLVLLTATDSFAALNLNVNPVTGGNDIRFGRVDSAVEVNREVRLRINSSDGTQYQVFQRLEQPINNDQGESLGFDAIKTYTLNGSNGSGTLYAQTPENLSMSDQLVYSSSPDGQSDSFVMIYSAAAENFRSSGNFLGKLIYTIRPIGAGSSDTAVVDITLEAANQFKIEVKGAFNHDKVSVNVASTEAIDFVNIAFSGNTGRLRVFQEIETFPQNDLLEPLTLGALTFRGATGSQGTLFSLTNQPLNNRRQLVYESNALEDSFQVIYEISAADLLKISAGNYRGRVRYVIETDRGSQDFSIDLEAKIEAIFKMDVKFPEGGVKFNDLRPGNPPQLNEIEVEVKSNLGRPFTVIQQTADQLTNSSGAKIEPKYFTVKELMIEGTGKINYADFSEVTTGDNPIFYSDARGSSAKFKVIYRLSPYSSMEPGDYSTAIKFALSEL